MGSERDRGQGQEPGREPEPGRALEPESGPAGEPPPHPVPDAAAYFFGRWSIERSVCDLRTGAEGSFRGTADFRPDPAGEGLLHIEEGRLRWGAAVHPASRTLRLRPRPDGTAEIRFADGRPFHDLDLRTGRWRAVHPCAADRYEGEFTVTGADTWQLEWRVGGPAKDQLLRSAYRRLT
ncbi:DUF6314 family protein [Streptomyces lydicus]|uniref:DUF6314 family protein n=1 Tax=Streptomyces lydicus TaxID=47763 RepID=UPI0010101F29|nr:DUF6314 family protein [Streptomyces lydicus]